MTKKRKASLSAAELVGLELDRASIVTESKQWKRPIGLLDEIHFAIHPHVHEGQLAPYGAIIASVEPNLTGWSLIAMPPTEAELGRQLADGIRSFALFVGGAFKGLLLPDGGTTSESALAMIVVRSLNGGAIITSDTRGLVRIIHRGGIAIHQHRQWREKPMVHAVISRIRDVAPMADISRLQELLLFAYHELSPRHIGATLVWCLQPPTAKETAAMVPKTDLTPLGLCVSNARHRPVLRHLLSQNDGAVIIDADNNVLGLGAHLKVSDSSIALIPQHRGTRHTSAQRFSFDCDSAIIVTVSADGPVTVFSDGLNVVELAFFNAATSAKGLGNMVPEKRSDIVPSRWPETCGNCGKTSIVEEVVIIGWKEREEAHCPICREVLTSSMCFQISAHVVKTLPPKSSIIPANTTAALPQVPSNP